MIKTDLIQQVINEGQSVLVDIPNYVYGIRNVNTQKDEELFRVLETSGHFLYATIVRTVFGLMKGKFCLIATRVSIHLYKKANIGSWIFLESGYCERRGHFTKLIAITSNKDFTKFTIKYEDRIKQEVNFETFELSLKHPDIATMLQHIFNYKRFKEFLLGYPKI